MFVCVYLCAALEFGRLFIESLRFLTESSALSLLDCDWFHTATERPIRPFVYLSIRPGECPVLLLLDAVRDDDYDQRSCSEFQLQQPRFYDSLCLTENCRGSSRVARGWLVDDISYSARQAGRQAGEEKRGSCFSCYAASQQSKTF